MPLALHILAEFCGECLKSLRLPRLLRVIQTKLKVLGIGRRVFLGACTSYHSPNNLLTLRKTLSFSGS